MGCDIHMQVEVRRNGKWERVEELPPRPCSWPDGDKHKNCWNCKGTGIVHGPYDGRNYTVFSVLADVRNDGYVKPICRPRGLPDDVADKDGDYGDHSQTWLTIAEVLSYDWQQEIRDEGWVRAEAFAKWCAAGEKGPPVGRSASIAGPSVRYVSHSDMRRRLATPYPWEGSDIPVTLIQWTVRVSEYCKGLLSFVDSLAPLGDPSDVRLVFGFDS